MEHTCEFCNTIFKTSSNLSNHKKNAKYCLSLRNKDNDKFKCEYCNKNFSSKSWMDIHSEKCIGHAEILRKELKKCQDDKDVLCKKIIQIEEKNIQIDKQLQEKDKQLQEKDKQIMDLQNKLENIAIKAATKPTHIQNNNNQRINQIVNNLIPITEEHLKEQAQYLTIEHVKNGANGYVQYALDYPLKDRVICTDFSRKKIKYKNEKGEIVDDPEMIKLSQHLFKALEEKNTELINQCLREIDRKYRCTMDNSGDDLNDKEAERFSGSLDFLFDELMRYKHQKIDVIDTASGKKSDLYYEFIKNICSKLCN